MNFLSYISHLLQVVVVAGGFWLAGSALAARLVPAWEGAPAVLARLVATLATAIVVAEALGLAGLLSAPALLLAAVALGIASRVVHRQPGTSGKVLSAPTVGRLGLALAAVAAFLTAYRWAGPVLQSLEIGIYRQDSTWYHLPLAAWFAQTGGVGDLLFTDPLKLTVWFYPLNAELLHGTGMVLFGNDLLSPLLNFGWMGLAMLAAWCIGRPLGLAPVTLLGAVLVLGSDMMLVQAGNAPSDVAAIACLLSAIAILANGREPGALALAALAAGLAVGTKVSMLAPIGVITIGVLAFGPGSARRRSAIWLGGLLATGGFWYLRNLAHAGNPLPWIQLGPLPGPEQLDLYPRPAHSMLEYLADRHAWTEYFLPGFADTLGPLWGVVLFASLGGLVLGLRPRHPAEVRVLALAGIATLLAHVLLPISASGPDGAPYGFGSNLRYAAPGLVIGLLLLPLCESRQMVERLILPAYLAFALLAAAGSEEWVQPNPAAAAAIAAAATLVPLWLARRPAPRAGTLALAALAALAVLAGYPEQRSYLENRYRPDLAPALDNPGFRNTRQWGLIQAWAREQQGMRIGIVGDPAAFGQYVLYGDGQDNSVRYVGERTAHGGLRPIGECRRWREAINEGGFDAVVITPENLGDPRPPAQIWWTGLDPAANPALLPYPAAAFLIAGRLDPDGCRHRDRGQFLSGPPFPGGAGPGQVPPILRQPGT